MKNSFFEERDGCAIVAIIDKRGRRTHANITGTIEALQKMGHRSGDIHGEGDGCGIVTDIPRVIWADRLAADGLSPHLAEGATFFVGHFLLPAPVRSRAETIISRIKTLFAEHNIELLSEVRTGMRENELGPRARLDAPFFWQAAGLVAEKNRQAAARKLYGMQLAIESRLPEIHIASLSLDSAVYKLQGTPDMLPRVYPELLDEKMRSVMCLGHSRYSTNTLPSVTLSQPFSVVCHNGEINTHDRLRDCGRAAGIDPVTGSSDSQSLNRVIEGLVYHNGLDIMEAMEMVFPAIHSEVHHYPPELQRVYTFYRWFFPCSAQGPAAVLARLGDACIGSVDALGLRPLWFVESDYDYVLSSEKGVVDLKRTINDPKPLAPGEKIAIFSGRGRGSVVLDYSRIQLRLQQLLDSRLGRDSAVFSFYSSAHSIRKAEKKGRGNVYPWDGQFADRRATTAAEGLYKDTALLGAFGWQHYDLMIREKVSRHGREVIGSLGHTGPLAAFVPESLPNIADYFKENVAVVTNPAIDREREREHFSTRVILGSRPGLHDGHCETPVGLEIMTPLLLGGVGDVSAKGLNNWRALGRKFDTMLLEDVLNYFSGSGRDASRVCILDATSGKNEQLPRALQRLHKEAAEAVGNGALLLVLDDSQSFTGNRVYIDPALAVASLGEYLLAAGLRNRAGIICRSAAVRNLHDIMIMLGLGADALNPYLLWQVSADFAGEEQSWQEVMSNTMQVLQKGMEKVMSTMGIHELGGYGRIFSPIGLSSELLAVFRTTGLCSSERAGLTFAELEKMGRRRSKRAGSGKNEKIYREPEKNPKVGRILRQVATGRSDYLTMSRELEKTAVEMPTGIRHLLDFRKTPKKKIPPDKVDISIGNHAMPLIIAAMSFGSQGENSFRTYARAAREANIICINGEGGEIPDMLGQFRANRGQQIASGRFGVSMEFLNSADFLEIKIGQGAKPGEGGHLPGTKVTAMVAAARHCKEGTTLISPANHHDIYSIEDLAQIITELKTANPEARVSVKIPVTIGVGTIAVGIAKAGADIINLSGFEGGTGAAREHAKRNVGLPVEIGVSYAHQALLEAGLRSEVELWADGGVRSGADVVKLVFLGANRVGLGTVVLMGIGCISCRRCHLDRCPRGISTQLGTILEAETRGVRGFKPRDIDVEVDNLTRLLNGIGDEIRHHLGEMGETRLQNLVGRTDLLVQKRLKNRLDAAEVLTPAPFSRPPVETTSPWVIHKPLDYLTKLFSDLTMSRFAMEDMVVHFAEDRVHSTDRAVGTFLAGAMIRKLGPGTKHQAYARFGASVPGNGLFAFNIPGVNGVVEGGSQDGAGKGSSGGSLSVLKGRNLLGRLVDGSTGKSFAYGATGGLFFIQNMADSRACIRMSGAEVIFGARIVAPVEDRKGNIASRAHLKGFAFEYMTGGTAVVLGDPGPWICAGMTGGVIYQCLYPEFGFDQEAVQRRLAESAPVRIRKLSKKGLKDVRRLLKQYVAQLENSLQDDEAAAVTAILQEAEQRFVMLMPAPVRPYSAE